MQPDFDKPHIQIIPANIEYSQREGNAYFPGKQNRHICIQCFKETAKSIEYNGLTYLVEGKEHKLTCLQHPAHNDMWPLNE